MEQVVRNLLEYVVNNDGIRHVENGWFFIQILHFVQNDRVVHTLFCMTGLFWSIITVIPTRSEESVRINYKYVWIMFIQWPTSRSATTIDNLC